MKELIENILAALEYDQVLSLLAQETVTPPGTALALALRPSFDEATVDRENRLTSAMAGHLESRGALPFGPVPDPAPMLSRLEIEGSVLAPLEVFDLVTLMKAGRSLKSALTEARAEFPLIFEIARDLPDLGNLVRFLDGKIAATGEMEDGASDELRAVRQEIRRRNERLKTALDAIVGRPEVARALQDTFISIRSDRHVIPIRAESQSTLQGIVHGVSGSGATVFIEPIETVDLNNEIVTLRDREAAEVQRLLQEYSDLLRGRLPEMRGLSSGIGRLDALSAKARLGRRFGARPARPSPAGDLRLEKARHPLLELSLRSQGLPIMPLDLAIPAGTRVLVISGPNTGGKTVALKTAGLLALMFQSGLPVPAQSALMPIFRGIFIDIGDRQSIPDRLSTFSARMTNIAGIAGQLVPPALVLLDEIGTGTDPEDGVALATAIVDFLRDQGAMVVATTHLEALKAYAATTAGCANAAMDFDESSSTPTYRLIPGIPGRSGGLEIARQLGLPEAILREARARRGHAGERISAYLTRLQAMAQELEGRLAEARDLRLRLDRERAQMTADLAAREAARRDAVAAEIELALKAMREEGESYLTAIKDREVAAVLRRQELKASAALRARARTLIRQTTGRVVEPSKPATSLLPGTPVLVEGLGLRGTLDTVRGDRAVVMVRGKRTTVALADCRPDRPQDPDKADRAPRLPAGVSLARKPGADAQAEIKILGLSVEEGLALVDKYLDDVYLEGLTPVRIVHGVGSGRLKRAVAELLAHHPHVEAFTSAPSNQGGEGVTIVELRV